MINPNAKDNQARNAKVEPPAGKPGDYPRVLYKGDSEHKLVRNADEEAAAKGFSRTPPDVNEVEARAEAAKAKKAEK